MYIMAVRTYLTSTDVFVVRIGVKHILGTRLLAEVHRAEVLRGMVDSTAQQDKLTVETKERCIAPVSEKAAVLEYRTHTSVTFDERILAVVEEVTVGTVYGLRVVQLHDAVGAIMDLTGIEREAVGTVDIETIGAAAIEVTVNDHVSPSSLHADDTTLTVAPLGMADGEVAHRTLLAVYETQAESIAWLHHDARVLLTLDNQLLHIDQRQLTTIEYLLADHRLAPAIDTI